LRLRAIVARCRKIWKGWSSLLYLGTPTRTFFSIVILTDSEAPEYKAEV
jgi:hypothetical protein